MDERKRAVCAAIDSEKKRILEVEDAILHTPELGYREQKTSEKVNGLFGELGLSDIGRCAVTGRKGWVRGRRHLARVALIGELDAVRCPGHPFADPATGAAHACGHNAQIAALFGCGIGLKAAGTFGALDGDLCFFATPAEEYVEIGYRKELIDRGLISQIGGKQELIAEGAFDDIDMAMMVHSETGRLDPRVVTGGPAMGFIGKTMRMIGKEAHAGGAPDKGINALNAAALAIMGINAQRETFRDADSVRVHPIITKGGDLVNIVPADVRMECYVRANSVAAMQDANRKVNRAVRGAAYSVGARAEIDDMPGYLPLRQDERMSRLFAANAAELIGRSAVYSGLPFAGSTDMGDLGYLMPVIQPTVSGFSGAAHSSEFAVHDPETAVLLPAKLMAMTAIDLLADGAGEAIAIREAFPRRTAAAYETEWKNILSGCDSSEEPATGSVSARQSDLENDPEKNLEIEE